MYNILNNTRNNIETLCKGPESVFFTQVPIYTDTGIFYFLILRVGYKWSDFFRFFFTYLNMILLQRFEYSGSLWNAAVQKRKILFYPEGRIPPPPRARRRMCHACYSISRGIIYHLSYIHLGSSVCHIPVVLSYSCLSLLRNAELFFMLLYSNWPRRWDGGFWQGGIRDGEIGDG
jgi:hypothetical protein